MRLIGGAALLGALAAVAAIALRGQVLSLAGSAATAGEPAVDPFAIELQHPIPVPAEAVEQATRIEALPVAFPGYLLPGEGEEEGFHARP